MPEKRRQERRKSLFYLGVFDRSTGELVGKLADMSSGGLMLIGEVPVKVSRRFDFRIGLPVPVMGRRELDFEARSVWCRQDLLPHFYSAGFQLLDLRAEDHPLLGEVANRYLFAER